ILIAAGGADVGGLAFPRPAAQYAGGALRVEPRLATGWGALIVLVPAILHPLVDAAAHIVETKRIGQEAADLQRLLGIVGLVATLAVGNALLRLVAPPIFARRRAACRVFPFGFARQ